MTQTAVKPVAKIGLLAKSYCNLVLPVEVLQSAAGYFIGTQEEGLPITRESMEYFQEHQEAIDALNTGNWKQRRHP